MGQKWRGEELRRWPVDSSGGEGGGFKYCRWIGPWFFDVTESSVCASSRVENADPG